MSPRSLESARQFTKTVRDAAVSLLRWRRSSEIALLDLALAASPDILFDVGANTGQFTRRARWLGFAGRVVSYEPGSEAFHKLRHTMRHDPNFECHNAALGARSDLADLVVTSNGGKSSSLRSMEALHHDSFAGARAHSVEHVHVLDTAVELERSKWPLYERALLKLDTQGMENTILDRLAQTDMSAWIAGILLEVSVAEPLYRDEWLLDDALNWASANNYELQGLSPGVNSPQSGRLLQVDLLLRRVAAAPSSNPDTCPYHAVSTLTIPECPAARPRG